jgi:2-dehydropantoate 2-reductase
MKIVIMGAGAIGSLFGGLLSKKYDVVLVGRKTHVEKINRKGLIIEGSTRLNVKTTAVESINQISFAPDVVVLAVKSYDTKKAMKQLSLIIDRKTVVVSLQNGLDNVEKIKEFVDLDRIFICITTHGVVFSKPGTIVHTGIGKTVFGGLLKKKSPFVNNFVNILNDVGVKTTVSEDILKDMWIKAIVNSSINPLTSIFNCKNGYLLKNPVLERIVEEICIESTSVAKSYGFNLNDKDMIKKTKEVINETSENYSSMLQSVKNNKKTEIDSINGVIVKIGEKKGFNVFLNKFLLNFMRSL